MFCELNEEEKSIRLDCNIKKVSEIFSFFSIIFSSLVIYITAKKTKLNIINKLILQILISEILDGINILLVIIDDAQGHSKFENYNKKNYVCFTQIYISLFSCLWTLSASFFISLRIYDIIIKKNALFKKKFMEKYVLIISAGVPAVIAYIFWITQVFSQSKKVKDLSKDLYYQKYHSHSHFRHMYCWFDEDRNYAIFSLVFLIFIFLCGLIFNEILIIRLLKLDTYTNVEIDKRQKDEIKISLTNDINNNNNNNNPNNSFESD